MLTDGRRLEVGLAFLRRRGGRGAFVISFVFVCYFGYPASDWRFFDVA
jgi:hypothetical protein